MRGKNGKTENPKPVANERREGGRAEVGGRERRITGRGGGETAGANGTNPGSERRDEAWRGHRRPTEREEETGSKKGRPEEITRARGEGRRKRRKTRHDPRELR